MIAVIDYKAGNLTSVVKALRYLDARDIVITQDPEVVRKADKIVLPASATSRRHSYSRSLA